jgi:hypothetical protein
MRRKRTSSLNILTSKRGPRDYYKYTLSQESQEVRLGSSPCKEASEGQVPSKAKRYQYQFLPFPVFHSEISPWPWQTSVYPRVTEDNRPSQFEDTI